MRTLTYEPCIGRNGWCWMTPRLGANEFVDIWGTSDDDVFVAGSASTLLHWNGTEWRQVVNPTETLANATAQEPAWLALTGLPTGELWLGGENRPLYAMSLSGTFTDAGASAMRILAATDGVQPYFVRINGSGINFLDKGPSFTAQAITPSNVRPHQMVATNGVAYVVFQEPDMRVWNSTGAVQTISGSTSGIDGITERLGVPALVTVERQLHAWNGSSWVPGDFAASRQNQHNFVQLPGGAVEWWYGGVGAEIHLSTGSGTQTTVVQSAFDWLFASWVSPQGTLWYVGGGGRIIRIPRGSLGPQEMGRLSLEGPVEDLSVAGPRVVIATAGGKVWSGERQADGGYSGASAYASGGNPLAVRASSTGSVVISTDSCVYIDGQSQVWCMTPPSNPATVSRAAGIDVDATGRVWASYGGHVARGLPVVGASLQQWQFPAWNQTADVLAVNGGAWVALNSVADLSSGDVRDGSVVFVPEDGGATTLCTPGDAGTGLFGLSRGLDGSVLVAGEGVLGRCTPAWVGDAVPTPLPAETLLFVSYIEAVDGRYWALASTGELFVRDAGATSWGRERLPLGQRQVSLYDRRGPVSRRLISTPDGLFIGAGSGGVLWKPLP